MVFDNEQNRGVDFCLAKLKALKQLLYAAWAYI